ncbi:MAG: glycine cleavage system protein [Parachlamydiales bacterium]|nr:glycine cleavage system protein [Parachlamydiales bacterium]
MKFTPSHEWIRCEKNIGTIGITEYAKDELGEIVHIELPKIGRIVKAGDELCVLESTKSATDVYSPVSGKVKAVNADLKSINQDAEKLGWLVQIELSNSKELDPLLSKAQYDQLGPVQK